MTVDNQARAALEAASLFRPDSIVIHYTLSDDVSAATVNKWHKQMGFAPRGSNPLKYIGYHALVRKNGTIEVGRSLDVQGTHCLGHNTHTWAICMCGSDSLSWYPTPEQYRSVAAWCENRMDEMDIPTSKLFFHRELSSTSCPGGADKNIILSLLGKSELKMGDDDMSSPLTLVSDEGEYVYTACPVFPDSSFAFFADVPNDYSVTIYIHPVANQPFKSHEYGCGGYENPNVKGAANVVGAIYPDLNGVASMVIHSPHKLVGGVW